MTLDEKLDEALKETFPASDAFWLPPEQLNGLDPAAIPAGELVARRLEASGVPQKRQI